VAGTGLGCGGSSVPGPTASPGGWTVSAGNDHRPTEERRQTGQRLSRRVGLATGAFAASMARSSGKSAWRSSAVTSTRRLCPVSTDARTGKRGARGPRLALTPWGGYARARLPGCLAGQVTPAAAMLADLRSAPPAAAILARPGCHAGWQRACAEIRPTSLQRRQSPKDDAHRPAALRILV
jgi:hypothetical protein